MTKIAILVIKLTSVITSERKYVDQKSVQACTKVNRLRILYTEFKPDITGEIKVHMQPHKKHFGVYQVKYYLRGEVQIFSY